MPERLPVSIRFPQLDFAVRKIKNLVHSVNRKTDVSSRPTRLVGESFNTTVISRNPHEARVESIIGIYTTGKEIDPIKIAQQLEEQGFDQVEISSILTKVEEKRRARE